MEKPINTIIDYFMIVGKYILRLLLLILLLIVFLICILEYNEQIDINDYIEEINDFVHYIFYDMFKK